MKLRRFSGKQRKLKPLLLRQVVGSSMLPKFREGGILVASGWFSRLRPHDVVIIHHDGKEKVKRIHKVRGDQVYVLGDNGPASTDSRHFGWIAADHVVAKVVWPRVDMREPFRYNVT